MGDLLSLSDSMSFPWVSAANLPVKTKVYTEEFQVLKGLNVSKIFFDISIDGSEVSSRLFIIIKRIKRMHTCCKLG